LGESEKNREPTVIHHKPIPGISEVTLLEEKAVKEEVL